MRLLVVFVLLVATSTPSLASKDFLSLIEQGKDEQAADALTQMIRQFGDRRAFKDSGFPQLLNIAVSSIRNHARPLSTGEPVILFRGISLGDMRIQKFAVPSYRSEYFFSSERPTLPAKALMTENRRRFHPEGIFDSIKAGKDFFNAQMDHANGVIKNSPFISASFLPVAPTDDYLILRIAPERFFASSGRNPLEHEVLIPFFIHPNEIMAIVRLRKPEEEKDFYQGESFGKGLFDFKWINPEFLPHDIRSSVREVIKRRISDERNPKIRNFRSHELELIWKKAGQPKYDQIIVETSDYDLMKEDSRAEIVNMKTVSEVLEHLETGNDTDKYSARINVLNEIAQSNPKWFYSLENGGRNLTRRRLVRYILHEHPEIFIDQTKTAEDIADIINELAPYRQLEEEQLSAIQKRILTLSLGQKNDLIRQVRNDKVRRQIMDLPVTTIPVLNPNSSRCESLFR